ncbi:FecR family protein [Sphingobacterium psychroaquaticum]|uniref:FecR family protein n=1 Tax=Sphingobacterium psychroaquaticum TaxID=561061 RepID=A0A1X7JS79_9SPHI|nr:FecR domain-containing protein [Sphingobacterium psychroaquaticum]SMG30621.1 FecR family protein [Sphingobacterium psychroaquaticum]
MKIVPRKIAALIAAAKIDSLSPEEALMLQEWRELTRQNEDIYQAIIRREDIRADVTLLGEIDTIAALDAVRKRMEIEKQAPKVIRLDRRLLAIASCILAISILAVLWWARHNTDRTSIIQPGTSKAYITVNGQENIALNESKGEIIFLDSMQYADGSTVLVNTDASKAMDDTVQITVPYGGEYKIVLSDGTKVMLNAGSSLRFPKRFTKAPREVQLFGEAYFNVAKVLDAKSERLPFFVQTKHQKIQVLGTQFNVSAYASDNETATTLVEGRVSVCTQSAQEQCVILEPGYRATTNSKQEIYTQKVDVFSTIAWTKNEFVFAGEPLSSVMEKVARWYDLEYTFKEPRLKKEKIEGILPRYASAKELFDLLQESGLVRFTVEGKKVTIY